jgi:hypothetical protein
MGRATEFYYYINQENIDKEDEKLYSHLTITDEIKQIRKDQLLAKKDFLAAKKSGLKPKGDGSFSLF